MTDRVERLTNLLALLLETSAPLSLQQIAAELEGHYPDGDNARRAAFERDKAALRDIGVPIETEMVEGGQFAGQTRYRVDRRRYELADLDLEPDEVRALQVAAATVRSGSTSSREAIWKLGGAVATDDANPAISAVVPDRPELPTIRAAVASRSTIAFGYRGQHRRVDPWGLLLRSGFWYVIGYDHDRAEQRTFRIDRLDPVHGIDIGPRGTFERPATFDPRASFPVDPKQLAVGPDADVDATVWVSSQRARAVAAELGEDRIVRWEGDGAVVVSVPATNVVAFRSWVLGLLDHAVVLEPPELRAHLVEWLTAVGEGT